MGIYKKVFIKTAEDLPKDGQEIQVHYMDFQDNSLYLRIYKSDNEKEWLRLVDWYLLPVELPSDEEIENGINVLAIMHAKQSVGDFAVGYIMGAKRILELIKNK